MVENLMTMVGALQKALMEDLLLLVKPILLVKVKVIFTYLKLTPLEMNNGGLHLEV